MNLQVRDASLLRFLVDMRDADLETKQMRDDLMTMLIAGEVPGCWQLVRMHVKQSQCMVLIAGEADSDDCWWDPNELAADATARNVYV